MSEALPATDDTREADAGRPARRLARLARLLPPAAVFLALTFLRTHGIAKTFWLLGDQILYWRIALGSWRDLPLGGGPSSVGGTTLGPVFCWTMWGIRHVVGPWTDNLPHAGGIGLSIIQSAADALLLAAVWKRTASLALAVALALLLGTAPFDMALTATIWNPPLAVAFVKIAIGFVLLGGRDASIRWEAGATAAALLAVQAHSSAVFFAAPVVASFVIRQLVARSWREAARRAAALAAVVLALEIPYLVNMVRESGSATSPALVVRSVSYTLSHPDALRPRESFSAMVSGTEYILLRPWTFAWAGTALVLCAAITAIRARRDPALIAVTVAPVVCAVVGFSFWQLLYDSYWFMTIAPSVALTIALAVTAWRPAAPAVAAVCAAAAILAVPARVDDSAVFFRLPEYGALARGSKEIRHRTPQIRRIDTGFALPPSTDPDFLYEVLGGRVTPDAPFAATIGPDGRVTFQDAPAADIRQHGG